MTAAVMCTWPVSHPPPFSIYLGSALVNSVLLACITLSLSLSTMLNPLVLSVRLSIHCPTVPLNTKGDEATKQLCQLCLQYYFSAAFYFY